MVKKTEQELLDSYKNRIKKQNNAIKDKYDRVSATLPKGTIDRINTLGLSINGVINQSVLSFLEQAENENNLLPESELPDVLNNYKSVDEIIQEEREVRKSRELYNPEVANMTPEELNWWINQKQGESAEMHKREQQRRPRGMSTAGEIADKLNINIKSVSDTDKIPDALDAKIEAIKNRKRDEI